MLDISDIPDLAAAIRSVGWVYASGLERDLRDGRSQYMASAIHPEPCEDLVRCTRRLGLSLQWAMRSRDGITRATRIFDAPTGRQIDVNRSGDGLTGDIWPIPGATPEEIQVIKSWPCPDHLEAGALDARLLVHKSAHEALLHSQDDRLRPGTADAYFRARAARMAPSRHQPIENLLAG